MDLPSLAAPHLETPHLSTEQLAVRQLAAVQAGGERDPRKRWRRGWCRCKNPKTSWKLKSTSSSGSAGARAARTVISTSIFQKSVPSRGYFSTQIISTSTFQYLRVDISIDRNQYFNVSGISTFEWIFQYFNKNL